MKDLKNKVVIVTGASSGIGEAMAREFAAQGARVVLGARSVQKLQLIAGDIRSRGGQAAYCGVDVTDVGECRELIDTAVREFGGSTCWFATPGFRCAPFSTTSTWRCCTA